MYPMVMFKAQVRTLEIGESGIFTAVGKRSRKIAWSEIKTVRERDGYIEISGRSKNAFILPPRAFKSDAERDQILFFAQNACASASGADER